MRVIALLALAILPSSLAGQEITGEWHGVLDVQGTQLRLAFHIEQTDSGYVTTMDSPDQGASGIPIAVTKYTAPDLRLELPNISAVYVGTVAGLSISGTWTQGITTLPLVLTRERAAAVRRNRPQEPVRPYPYHEQAVVIRNAQDDVTLAGTLTLPANAGPHPAVVLISGSGAQNRDEELFGHRPFLVLADHLTRLGIAVLRYDDRGTGQSTGSFATATSRDFAADAASAVAYLASHPEIDRYRIGLIGHSEGALVAPMVATRSSDVAFIVLLAGIGLPGREVSLLQSRDLRPFPVPDEAVYDRFTRTSIDIASSSADLATKRAELTRHYESIAPVLESVLPDGVMVDEFIAQQVADMTRPWHQFFLTYDPGTDLEKVTVPVLSLNGSNDVQVPAALHQDGIRRALERGGNVTFLIGELPGLNHMFQESETGAMNEYAMIEQTFSPVALNAISNWMA
ncbi:MAG: alpha/beta fold hydrolase [Gemmatimonas sp.]|nr:alpha/beta fold hydrolase [Gemmatimonas sp.]